jgi:hypothetical protein
MLLNRLLDQGKSQSGSLGLAGDIWVEYSGAFRGRDTRTVIRHPDDGRSIGLVDRDRHVSGAAGSFNRVA